MEACYSDKNKPSCYVSIGMSLHLEMYFFGYYFFLENQISGLWFRFELA